VKTRATAELRCRNKRGLGKRRQIARAARGYRRMMGLTAHRFDTTCYLIAKPDGVSPRIELLKGFWTDEQLQKRSGTSHIGIMSQNRLR